jgi:hypothetical protein
LEGALQLSYTLEDNMMVAGVTSELGVVAQLRHEYEKATHYQQHALTLLNELGFQTYTALVLTRLGNLALLQADLTSAHAYYAESLSVCQRTGSKRSLASGLEGLAGVAALSGRARQVAQILGAAEAYRQAIGLVRSIDERAVYAQTVAAATAALGAAQFEAECLTGRTTALQDVIIQVLG